ncbi:MAG: diaminopimelate decarboxylase [Armatimonadetes bacterium]|nr:diaminopimelate decarboxylase [Armatimonadota bacterium]
MLLGTQRINAQGHLEVGGCDTVALARRFGTPLYVMDEALLRANCRAYRRAFAERYSDNEVLYAGKAFLCTAMCALLHQEGIGLDVASAGELRTALAAGFPPERVFVHGNFKSRPELEAALAARVRRIIVDSEYELEELAAVAREGGRVADILLRVTPGIDPHTHRLIRTGQEDTKFGIAIQCGQAARVIARALEMPSVRVRGIHFHVGSQLLDLEAHQAAIRIGVDLLARLRADLGFEASELNIGGGLGIRYLPSHEPPSISSYADRVVGTLDAALARHGLPRPRLLQEPGRSIVGEAGLTLYTVGPVKEIPGVRTHVAVDGGLSDNPRPALYEARYEVIIANKAAHPADRVVTVSGKHCETDTLFADVSVAAGIAPGDVLAVQSTGAYNYSMASNYNRFAHPAVVLVNDGQADVIVERQTVDDLVRQDVVPDRLRIQ